jgi:hypothetical protein
MQNACIYSQDFARKFSEDSKLSDETNFARGQEIASKAIFQTNRKNIPFSMIKYYKLERPKNKTCKKSREHPLGTLWIVVYSGGLSERPALTSVPPP